MEYSFPAWIKLLKDWQLASSPSPKGDIMIWKVFKTTAKKTRLIGHAEFSSNLDVSDVPRIIEEPLIQRFSKRRSTDHTSMIVLLALPSAKVGTTPEQLMRTLIRCGYLTRWVRFHSDGISENVTEFGPGSILENQISSRNLKSVALINTWIECIQNDTLALNEMNVVGLSTEQSVAVKLLLEKADELIRTVRSYMDQTVSISISAGPANWPFSQVKSPNNYMLAMEFLLSLARAIIISPSGFDWKEIGAISYNEIGGSKRFDSLKDGLFVLAEEITDTQLSDLGLISKGSLYSIYLSGLYRLSTQNGYQEHRVVCDIYAITNIQADRIDEFQFNGKIVICTENRALLLKMYSSGWVARRPDVLVIGIDGQLKRGHRHLLQTMVKQNSNLEYFTWVDTDPAGVVIAGKLNEILPRMRVIISEADFPSSFLYEDWLQELNMYNENKKREQENSLGNPDIWNRLFSCS